MWKSLQFNRRGLGTSRKWNKTDTRGKVCLSPLVLGHQSSGSSREMGVARAGVSLAGLYDLPMLGHKDIMFKVDVGEPHT